MTCTSRDVTTILAVLIITLAGLVGCSNSSTDANPAPEISSISPTEGPHGITITISGSGFSSTASQNRVSFAGKLAKVTSASASSIEAVVPKEAGSGPVDVAVGGQVALGPNFTVEEQMPGITSVEPDSGVAGTEVVITGMNFSSAPAENIITFNGGVIAEVREAGETQLITKVPEGAKSGPIGVEVEGEKKLSPSFEVIITGILQTEITTVGPDPEDYDSDGYTLSIDGVERRQVNSNEMIYIKSLGEGVHQARLSNISATCSLEDENPKYFEVTAGDTTNLSLQVSCKEVLKNQIVFSSGSSSNSNIFAMNPDGSEMVQLTDETDEAAWPYISPDGTQIVFVRYGNNHSKIKIMNADGSGLRTLVYNNDYNVRPKFSPDGKKVVFQRNDGIGTDIYVVNADGSNMTAITNNNNRDWRPVWSPDGSWIAYASDEDIFLADPEGVKSSVNLTQNATFENNPSFSPDGSRIVYESYDGDDTEIRILNTDQPGAPYDLTNNMIDDENPEFSRDGTQIVYNTNDTGDREIRIVDADGTGTPAVIDDTHSGFAPAFSPGGNYIYYRGSDGSDNEIYKLVRGGSTPINITDNTSREGVPYWGPNNN